VSIKPATIPAALSELLSGSYATRPEAFDELIGPDGQPRGHWAPVIGSLIGLGRAELTRRWEQARKLLRENGVTFNVYGDPRGLDRPWELDPVPLLIEAGEWQAVERGLVQRAKVLDLLLADLYGEQRTVREGLFPPEIVFENPRFLRPCFGGQQPGGGYLHLYAVDMVRSPSGEWSVLSDRTQAPSGAGYSLENRIIMSRTFPEAVRDCRVERLARFFQRYRDLLGTLAPRRRENPRIVILTPGPANESYFEHSYLSRYLGYPLVEGSDLTVRDNCVYLKTLGGLQPVDVIVRRVDDDWCDPLELRGESSLGVTGLVEAVRSGNAVVSNALGSGILETRSLLPFVPGLTRYFLGEDTRLGAVETWWCGTAEGLDHVIQAPETFDLMPAYPSHPHSAYPAEHIGGLPFTERIERLRRHPHRFAAQRLPEFSTAPVWNEGKLEPRRVVMRAYLVRDADGNYHAMPGGLTRVTAAGSAAVSMQSGGGSKDTWVLASEDVQAFSLLPPPGQPVQLTRAGADLPSRTADNLFWLGRYLERAEANVRLLRSAFNRLAEGAGSTSDYELSVLMNALQSIWKVQASPSGDTPRPRSISLESELLSAAFDAKRDVSLASLIESVHRTAWRVRDRLSMDSWRNLSRLYQEFQDSGAGARPQHPAETLALLNQTLLTLSAFSGLAMESMTRGPGWRFMDMGRRLERSVHACDLLASLLTAIPDDETTTLQILLEIADSSMTYRSRYSGQMQLAPVLDLLLTDETNPHSVAFQFVALTEHVSKLPRASAAGVLAAEEKAALAVLTRLRLVDVFRLSEADSSGRRAELSVFLDSLAADIPALSDTIVRSYFTHTEFTRQLMAVAPEAE